ncbi:preprotein translocase subunit SecE [Streptomyces sp. NPDC059985]|uniref:preprotein translocase subunit SecE n=1 Tax=Streptomyces sp. NPDC059985 TaxID=3347025 RepID=UPI003688355E
MEPLPPASSGKGIENGDDPRSRGDNSNRDRKNPLQRLRTFIRQILAELRKVVWPDRRTVRVYSTVVLIFVVIMVLFVFGLDTLFSNIVRWVFG